MLMNLATSKLQVTSSVSIKNREQGKDHGNIKFTRAAFFTSTSSKHKGRRVGIYSKEKKNLEEHRNFLLGGFKKARNNTTLAVCRCEI